MAWLLATMQKQAPPRGLGCGCVSLESQNGTAPHQSAATATQNSGSVPPLYGATPIASQGLPPARPHPLRVHDAHWLDQKELQLKVVLRALLGAEAAAKSLRAVARWNHLFVALTWQKRAISYTRACVCVCVCVCG